jgi:hypothetical protein
MEGLDADRGHLRDDTAAMLAIPFDFDGREDRYRDDTRQVRSEC